MRNNVSDYLFHETICNFENNDFPMEQIFANIVLSTFSIERSKINSLFNLTESRFYSKGDYFISAGEIPNKFAFTVSGLFRYFYIDSDGNEFTKGFFPEKSVLSSYSAMIHKRPSYFYIEALEDSIVQVIYNRDWEKLLEQEPCWKDYLIALLQKGYCVKEAREREFLLLDAETRYKNFLATFPGLEKRIKQHYIASYLGITPVALSRIRRKMGVVNPG